MRVGRRDGLDVEHVTDPALREAGPELGDVAISAIAQHRRRLKAPHSEFVDHLQRQLPLGQVTDVLGQMRPNAPGSVEIVRLVPRLRDKQPPVQRARRLRGHRAERHSELAVADLAQRTAILPRHAD